MTALDLRPAAALFAAIVFAASCGPTARTADEPVPLGMLPDGVTPTHYRIALEIDPRAERFSGRTEIDILVATGRSAFFIHGYDLQITEAQIVAADGATIAANYEQIDDSGIVRLSFEDEVPAGESTLTFRYDASFNTALAGLYKVVDSGDSYAFSQLEPTRARRVFPSFDEPRFKTPFDIVLTGRAEDTIIGNTIPIAEEMVEGGWKRVTLATTEPLPTYLLAFAVGPLDVVESPAIPANEIRERPIPLRGITARGRGEQIRFALQNTADIVAILERYFATPYPFDKLDIIAAPDFAAGAMENAGAIVYRETLILMDENAPLRQKRGYAYVHAHELAHQWFGNLVTPHWWDDIWLNEAFATWIGHAATATWYPQGEYDRDTLHDALWVMGLDSLPSARRIHEPVNNSDDIANAFDGITYSKGAGVLAMFERFLGEEAFREGVRLHMQRFGFGVATTDDFMTSLADGANQPDVFAAFSSFIDQPGVPLVTVRSQCDNGRDTVSLSQASYAPIGITPAERSWQIPVCVRVAGPGGGNSCVVLNDEEMEVSLANVCTRALMPNAGGGGYYRFALDADGWQRLIAAKDLLDAAEQVSLIDNLAAAVRADQADATLLFEAIAAIVPNGPWDSVEKAMDVLAELEETVIGPGERAQFEARVQTLFRPRFDALGLSPRAGEPVADTLLRHGVAWHLVRYGNDAELRASLAESGRNYVASGGHDLGMLSPDLAVDALWSAMADGDSDFGYELMDAIRGSSDAEFRRSALAALTAADDPAFLDDVHALMLSDELRGNETMLLMGYLLSTPQRYDGAWTWIKANLDELEARVQTNRMSGVISRLDNACDANVAANIEAVFQPHLDRYEGSPRQLALALETINRCVAFKEAKGGEIATAIQGWN